MSLDERARQVRAEIGQQVASTEPPSAAAIARRSRRGRLVTGLAAVALVALTGVGIAVARDDAASRQQPVTHDPEPSTTTTIADGTTPEETRAEGAPVGVLGRPSGPSPAGLDVQVYCLAEATTLPSPCDTYRPYDASVEQHWALEVTQGDQSALFEVLGPPAVTDFDDHALLVQDNTAEATRYRLLHADGTATELREPNTAAPAVPGPDVRLLEALDAFRSGMLDDDGNHQHPYLVDADAGTIQPLDVPDEIEWWGPNVDEALWGGADCTIFWQRPDRSFDRHDIDCAGSEPAVIDPGWNWPDLDDWLEPGRLVAIEWDPDSSGPRVVHASLDGGATWTRREIRDRPWGDTTRVMEAAIEQALG